MDSSTRIKKACDLLDNALDPKKDGDRDPWLCISEAHDLLEKEVEN